MISSASRLGALLAIAIIAILVGRARAHEPYSDLKNPITGVSCCNSGDCKPVDAREIGEDGDSYTYQGARFPKRQSQESPDHRYHVCAGVEWHLNGTSRLLIRCLLRPFSGT